MPKEAMLRATSMALLFAIVSSQCGPENKEAFPPGQNACPPAPGGGEGGGTTDYTKGAPLAAPLRGKVGTVEIQYKVRNTIRYPLDYAINHLSRALSLSLHSIPFPRWITP